MINSNEKNCYEKPVIKAGSFFLKDPDKTYFVDKLVSMF